MSLCCSSATSKRGEGDNLSSPVPDTSSRGPCCLHAGRSAVRLRFQARISSTSPRDSGHESESRDRKPRQCREEGLAEPGCHEHTSRPRSIDDDPMITGLGHVEADDTAMDHTVSLDRLGRARPGDRERPTGRRGDDDIAHRDRRLPLEGRRERSDLGRPADLLEDQVVPGLETEDFRARRVARMPQEGVLERRSHRTEQQGRGNAAAQETDTDQQPADTERHEAAHLHRHGRIMADAGPLLGDLRPDWPDLAERIGRADA